MVGIFNGWYLYFRYLCDILYVVAGAKVYFNLPNGQINMKIKEDNLDDLQNVNPSILSQFEIANIIIENKDKHVKLLNYIDAIKLKINDLKEFTEIITNNNLINLDMVISNYNDCLDQIIFNVFKLSNELTLDIYKLFELVHESNMSKVCIDLDTAIRSVKFYQEVEKRYNMPKFREIIYNNKTYWVIYDDETKKILKSINYKAVNFLI